MADRTRVPVRCLGCGETNPADQHGGGHIVTVAAHHPGCNGANCDQMCPVPEQDLCGPVEVIPDRSGQ